MYCPKCGSKNTIYLGTLIFSTQEKYQCDDCQYCYSINPMFVPYKATKPSGFKSNKDELEKNSFVTGIPKEQLKDCPWCGEHRCYHIGISPVDIKCSNYEWKFYERYEESSINKEYDSSIFYPGAKLKVICGPFKGKVGVLKEIRQQWGLPVEIVVQMNDGTTCKDTELKDWRKA